MSSTSSTLYLLLVLFCLCYGCPLCRAVDNTNSEDAGFVPNVLTFPNMDEFTETTLALQTPLVLVVSNKDDPTEWETIWEPFVRELSLSLHDFLIKVGYVASQSKVGEALQDIYAFKAPALMFFDGFLASSPLNSSILGKFPKFYSGELDYKLVLRWILQSISPDFITRLEHENDLFDWLNKMPEYPKLPKVLYFTRNPYVGPVYRLLSQAMHPDAIFGVVVDAFDGDPRKNALAQRYNISQKSELPVLLVLHRHDSGKAGVEDEVHRLESVTAKSTLQSLIDILLKDIPEASANIVRESGEGIDSITIEKLWGRRLYILGEAEKERQEILNYTEKETSSPFASYNTPVVVHTQVEWEKNCIHLPTGHQCLVTFTESTSIDREFSILKRVAEKIAGSVGAEIVQRAHFVVADAATSGELMEFFGIRPGHLPAVVLIASDTQMYYIFDGSLLDDRLVEFLQSKLQAQTPSGGKSFRSQKMPPFSVPNGDALKHPSGEGQERNEGDL